MCVCVCVCVCVRACVRACVRVILYVYNILYEQVLDERAGDDELDDDKDKQDDKYETHNLNPLSVYSSIAYRLIYALICMYTLSHIYLFLIWAFLEQKYKLSLYICMYISL